MADFGNGATLVMATSGFVACYTELDSGEETAEAIDVSCLDTVGGMAKDPADLADGGEASGIFQWDAAQSPPPLRVKDTFTYTYPQDLAASPPQTAPATLSGTGFITRIKRPTMRNNEVMEGELTITWDGLPTYTPATT